MKFNTVEEAVEELKQGKMIIVIDDENRENEGDLLMVAEKATPEAVNFMISKAKGLLCTPMSEERSTALGLNPMVAENTDPKGTAFTVSIDHATSTTGISAFERSHTIMSLCGEGSQAEDFTRPGHVFPLVAKAGGVLERPGHTEAAVDLAKMAGFSGVGVICEIIKEDGSMARVPDLMEFAKDNDLKIITIESLIRYRLFHSKDMVKTKGAKLPTKHGEFKIYGYESPIDGKEHVALVMGDVAGEDVLMRIHSECLTGDAFGSLKCDCGDQLNEALKRIANEGRGILLYLRQEGRGIGLLNKIRAYALQDEGYDTVDANTALGLPEDGRDYQIAGEILRDLHVKSVKLMTNNPAKIEGLEEYGVRISGRMPIEMNHNERNHFYLKTKQQRMGHILSEV